MLDNPNVDKPSLPRSGDVMVSKGTTLGQTKELTTQIHELDIYNESDLNSDIEHRQAIVERALRLQLALGPLISSRWSCTRRLSGFRRRRARLYGDSGAVAIRRFLASPTLSLRLP